MIEAKYPVQILVKGTYQIELLAPLLLLVIFQHMELLLGMTMNQVQWGVVKIRTICTLKLKEHKY